MQLRGSILVKHDLDNKFACRKDAGYCGSHNGVDIYVFKIIDIEIGERLFGHHHSKIGFYITIRGEHTCWMDLDNFYVADNKEELIEYIEQRHMERLINTVTYTVSTNPQQRFTAAEIY